MLMALPGHDNLRTLGIYVNPSVEAVAAALARQDPGRRRCQRGGPTCPGEQVLFLAANAGQVTNRLVEDDGQAHGKVSASIRSRARI